MFPSLLEVQRTLTRGIPLSELESRLKPNGNGVSWSDASTGGFLAPNESLIDVVERDYHTLSELGIDYEQMAKMTADVLSQSAKEAYCKGTGLMRETRRLLARYWNPSVKIDRRRFTLFHIGSFGSQSCPWGCRRADEFGYRTSGSNHVYVSEKRKEMSDIMKKLINGERDIVEFGGMDRVLYLSYFLVITDLTPHLIASHHFFEGEAAYRTDPKRLLKVVRSGEK